MSTYSNNHFLPFLGAHWPEVLLMKNIEIYCTFFGNEAKPRNVKNNPPLNERSDTQIKAEGRLFLAQALIIHFLIKF